MVRQIGDLISMSLTQIQDALAPTATKTGAGLTFLASAVAWVSNNVGFFSVISLMLGAVIGAIGVYFQSQSAISARRLADEQNQRESEIHELRKAALLKQVHDA